MEVWGIESNLRREPSTDGAVVLSVPFGERLELVAAPTETTSTIVIRGKVYQEPWLNVKTSTGETGWVYGGTVKLPGQRKGNAFPAAGIVNFHYFGNANLSEWELLYVDTEGEEVDQETKVYRNGELLLELTDYSVGEFTYGTTQKLMDADRKVLMERSFTFETDPTFTLTETASNYKSEPAEHFRRTQEIDQHYYQLNDRPLMVNGKWTAYIPDREPVTPDPVAEPKVQPVGLSDCGTIAAEDSGCSCSLGEGADFYGESIFLSNMSKLGCMKINGQSVELLTDGPDYIAQLLARTDAKAWITIPESGDFLLFGEPTDFSNRDFLLRELVNTLLIMESPPEQIPIENRSTGMAIRDIRDLAEEAVAEAKKRKSEGKGAIVNRTAYVGDDYRVIVRIKRLTNNEGEADQYEGMLELLTRDGRLLAEKDIRGNCGC